MSTMLEAVNLSLRKPMLSNTQVGEPFIDHVVKLGVKPDWTRVEITRVTTFDGLSLQTFNARKHFRDAITVKKGGAVKRGPGSSLGTLAEESLDASGKILGVGSIVQLRDIAGMALKMTGLIPYDGSRKYRTALNLGRRKVGEAVYAVRKYHLLERMPPEIEEVIPEEDVQGILEKPTLITKAAIKIDLVDATPNKTTGNVDLNIRENYRIGSLESTHRNNVIITTWHDVKISSLDTKSSNAEKTEERHREMRILNLEQMDYPVITTHRR